MIGWPGQGQATELWGVRRGILWVPRVYESQHRDRFASKGGHAVLCCAVLCCWQPPRKAGRPPKRLPVPCQHAAQPAPTWTLPANREFPHSTHTLMRWLKSRCITARYGRTRPSNRHAHSHACPLAQPSSPQLPALSRQAGRQADRQAATGPHLQHGQVCHWEVPEPRDVEKGNLVGALLEVAPRQLHWLAQVAHLVALCRAQQAQQACMLWCIYRQVY